MSVSQSVSQYPKLGRPTGDTLLVFLSQSVPETRVPLHTVSVSQYPKLVFHSGTVSVPETRVLLHRVNPKLGCGFSVSARNSVVVTRVPLHRVTGCGETVEKRGGRDYKRNLGCPNRASIQFESIKTASQVPRARLCAAFHAFPSIADAHALSRFLTTVTPARRVGSSRRWFGCLQVLLSAPCSISASSLSCLRLVPSLRLAPSLVLALSCDDPAPSRLLARPACLLSSLLLRLVPSVLRAMLLFATALCCFCWQPRALLLTAAHGPSPALLLPLPMVLLFSWYVAPPRFMRGRMRAELCAHAPRRGSQLTIWRTSLPPSTRRFAERSRLW